MRARRWLVLLSAVLSMSLLTGCVGSAGGTPSDPRSGGALRYGLAPQPDKGVTFQPGVVLVEGGASSVRSVTADGLTWTLSPAARGIGDLRPGRVMFLTDRGVGRVLAVRTAKTGVEVTIGPADLTDVIKDGDFASSRPVPIENPVAIPATGAFWADPALQQQAGVEQGAGADLPVSFRSGGPAPAALPRPPAPRAVVSDTLRASTGAFDLTAACCSAGPSTSLSYKRGGLSMSGRVGLDMQKPTANFRLHIAGGTVKDAGLTVRGAAAITATLTAMTQPGGSTQGTSPPLGTDFSFSVPVGVFFGVPLSMAVTQHFTMAVNIPGQARLDTMGKLRLGSTIGFSYHEGKFANTTSASLDTSTSLRATNSIAVGISYATFDYNVRFTVGLGFLGFVAGLYLALGAHVTLVVGAPIGINPLPDAEDSVEHCKSVQGDLWVDYGIGYTIPTPVAAVINFFLSAFKAEPIKTSGGISHGWQPVLSRYEVFPQSGFCVNK